MLHDGRGAEVLARGVSRSEKTNRHGEGHRDEGLIENVLDVARSGSAPNAAEEARSAVEGAHGEDGGRTQALCLVPTRAELDIFAGDDQGSEDGIDEDVPLVRKIWKRIYFFSSCQMILKQGRRELLRMRDHSITPNN